MKSNELFSDTVRIAFTTADPERILNHAQQCGIELHDVHYTNDLEVICKVSRKQYKALKSVVERAGSEISFYKRFGLLEKLRMTTARPVLLSTLLVLLFLTFYLPSRVLFICVEGNSILPEKLIIESAEECGIGFGASRRAVRSELVKNRLLQAIPELSWAGVTTDGCTAVIAVREKEPEPAGEEPRIVTGIYASCDGIVEQCVVTRGNPLCKVGDAVSEGQLLVSGYTDCGIAIQATRSEAEVYAKTLRTLSVKSLTHGLSREKETKRSVNYSVVIGKKQIKFYKDSGISDGRCVKMRKELCLTLPGGFRLPLKLVKESIVSYDTSAVALQSFDWIGSYACTYLQGQMQAGTILSEECVTDTSNGVYDHSGTYRCYEMIGVEKVEEIIK